MGKAFLVLWLLLLPVSGYASEGGAGPVRAWDQILKACFLCDRANFKRTVQQTNGERVYAYTLTSAKSTEIVHSVVIAVGPVGKHLNAKSWQTEFNKSDQSTRVRVFPDIGLRAKNQPVAFSPAGAITAVAFTTPDGFFDVLVSIYEKSNSETKLSLSSGQIARRIVKSYRETIK